MKFAANLSTLFEDIDDIGSRYKHLVQRKDFSFDAIEMQNPYQKSIEEWKSIQDSAGKLKCVLINSPIIWDQSVDAFSQQEFEAVLKKTRDYAVALDVTKVHLLLFDTPDQNLKSQVLDRLLTGCRFLQPEGITVVIEPLSIRPNYYLRSYDYGRQIVDQLKQPNLKILLDTFHLQRLHGNLTYYIQNMIPYVGHVQVSQTPLRDCPFNEGEVNHKYVIKLIDSFYKDYVGLEYINKTTDSFDWLKQFK